MMMMMIVMTKCWLGVFGFFPCFIAAFFFDRGASPWVRIIFLNSMLAVSSNTLYKRVRPCVH